MSQARRKQLERKAIYNVTSHEITDWQPLVKRHREASQLDFKDDENRACKNFANKLECRELRDNSVVQEINEVVRTMNAENTDKATSVPAAVASELMKNKHLLLYQEIKAKRVKKIKSKQFRRIRKKQQQKEADRALALRVTGDKEALLEEIEKMEVRRAEVCSVGTSIAETPQ